MAVCFLPLPAEAAEKTLVLGLFDNEPYMGEKLPEKGMLAALVTEAFRREGFTVKYKFLPLKRLYTVLDDGEIDGAVGAPVSAQRKTAFLYSAPLYRVNYNFFARKQDQIRFTSLAALKPYRIGVVRGGLNETELLAAGMKVDAVSDHMQNIRKLLVGRVDLIVSVTDYTNHLLQTKTTLQERSQLEMLAPPFAVRDKYFAMSKKRYNSEKLMVVFNRSLARMKKDGSYDEIVRRFRMVKP